MLIELDGSDEPAWVYLEYQHSHIMEKMRSTFQKASEAAKRKWFPCILQGLTIQVHRRKLCSDRLPLPHTRISFADSWKHPRTILHVSSSDIATGCTH